MVEATHKMEPCYLDGGWATDWLLKKMINQRVADRNRVKATVESVVEDLQAMREEPINLLVADQPYPFTYDGTSLSDGFDHSNFKDRSLVGVEVTVMAYRKQVRAFPGTGASEH